MSAFPSVEALAALESMLSQRCALPADPVAERIVTWHVFRHADEAKAFARHVMLDEGESLVGGATQDSLGELYWVGVQVEDIDAWGDRRAIHKTDFVDPQNPKSPML